MPWTSPPGCGCPRGEKLRFCKRLPTLRHIALVYQDQMRVEHYRRTDEGWRIDALTRPDQHLGFEAIGFEIGLDQIYFGVPSSALNAAP